MHELVIVEGILDVVVPEARKHGANQILSIRLKVGELSGVIPECVREYFTVAARGTMAEGAKVLIDPLPIRIRCRDCRGENEIRRGMDACPVCGSRQFRIISGREYYIESVEAE